MVRPAAAAAPALAYDLRGASRARCTYTFTATAARHLPLSQRHAAGSCRSRWGWSARSSCVRPTADPLHQAYGHADTGFDHEYLFLLTEMDPAIHDQVAVQVAAGGASMWTPAPTIPVLWFINGRNAPDTMLDANVPWLPTQPYNCLPRMHAGEKVLMRVIDAGRDLHPFHTHGNNITLIARDGRLLESVPGAGPDLASSDFTLRDRARARPTTPSSSGPARTWAGTSTGTPARRAAGAERVCAGPRQAHPGDPAQPAGPHLRRQTTAAARISGSFGALPPGQARSNENAGYFHMWHSHNEREIVNNDIFPGGMMTMLIIEPAGVPIP